MPFSRVLVVEEQNETGQVLTAALAGREIEVVAARPSAQGLELARRCHPDLIVLDLPADAESIDADAAEAWRVAGGSADTQLLVLGRVQGASRPSQPALSKPYHYAALIRKIEQLLSQVGAGHRRAA